MVSFSCLLYCMTDLNELDVFDLYYKQLEGSHFLPQKHAPVMVLIPETIHH